MTRAKPILWAPRFIVPGLFHGDEAAWDPPRVSCCHLSLDILISETSTLLLRELLYR